MNAINDYIQNAFPRALYFHARKYLYVTKDVKKRLLNSKTVQLNLEAIFIDLLMKNPFIVCFLKILFFMGKYLPLGKLK